MDIRWEQRFSNYIKAFDKLSQSVDYIRQHVGDVIEEKAPTEVLSEMIREGLIQRFEYTHELAWNVMKDYAEYQGNATVAGSRDAVREAFRMQLIKDGETWMDMIASRNKTSHTYNEEVADEIYGKILNEYFPLFSEFRDTMEQKRTGDQKDLF
ncbi:MAG TPA: nucleotidyltransferase substrate binding protein [Flavobacterium sp.]|nr:nucleotidyltransferase substrate binding protein [Flavobacterium sp.]